MWRYYLQGLQHDAWELLGGEMAVKLLAKVLRNTLHFLALRYTSVCPSEHRTSQYRYVYTEGSESLLKRRRTDGFHRSHVSLVVMG